MEDRPRAVLLLSFVMSVAVEEVAYWADAQYDQEGEKGKWADMWSASIGKLQSHLAGAFRTRACLIIEHSVSGKSASIYCLILGGVPLIYFQC